MTTEHVPLEQQIAALQFALAVLAAAPRRLTDQERHHWLPRLSAALETLRTLEFGRATLG
jgi:hypothetical protein